MTFNRTRNDIRIHTHANPYEGGPIKLSAIVGDDGGPITIITSSEFPDDEFYIVGSISPTKRARFEVDGFTANTDRTFTLPDASMTVAGVNLAQSWSALQSFPDSMLNIVGSSDATKILRFEVDGLSVGTRTLTPQNASYTIAGLETANVFTATQTISGSFLTIRNDPGNEALTITNAAGTVTSATIDGNGVGAFADGTGTHQPLYLFRGAYGSGTYAIFDVSLLTSGRIITVPDQDGTLIYSGQTITVGLSTSSFLVSDTQTTGASFRDTTVTSKRLRVILSSSTGNNAFDIRGTSDIYRFPDLGAGTVTMTMAGSIGALTSTRIPFADASGFLTDSGNMTFVTDTLSVNKVAMSSLTSTRVPFATTAGLLIDSGNMTFATDTLSVNKVAMSSLTSTRVPFASTAGLLIDATGFTFVTDTLTVPKEVISTNLQVAGGAVLTALTAGVYTPTLTNVTNVAASTAFEAQYLRVGNTVTVSGRADIDPTTAGIATILGISLPVASNLGANEDCCGIMNGSSGTTEAGYVAADTTNDRASAAIIPILATNQSFYFHFTYQVI